MRGVDVLKKLMLIINPHAGNGRGSESLGRAMSVLYTGGFLPTVYYTAGAGDATRLVLEYAPEYDCVVCIGGDGTLSETVSGLCRLESPPVLGYIPRGTANDMAATLKLPQLPTAAAKVIVSGSPQFLDAGRFNSDEYFTYVAAFGAFTEVSYETSQQAKQVLGHLAYVLQGIAQLPRIAAKHAVVECEGERLDGRFLYCGATNSESVAGLVNLKKTGVELNDGLFEVILVKEPANIMESNRIAAAILNRSLRDKNILIYHTDRVSFTFDEPVKWTRDGEPGGRHQRVVLQNIHSAYSMMIPSENHLSLQSAEN